MIHTDYQRMCLWMLHHKQLFPQQERLDLGEDLLLLPTLYSAYSVDKYEFNDITWYIFNIINSKFRIPKLQKLLVAGRRLKNLYWPFTLFKKTIYTIHLVIVYCVLLAYRTHSFYDINLLVLKIMDRNNTFHVCKIPMDLIEK